MAAVRKVRTGRTRSEYELRRRAQRVEEVRIASAGSAARTLRTEQEAWLENEPEEEKAGLRVRQTGRRFHVNMVYLVFLTLAAVVCVGVLVNYLQLKETYTGLQKTRTSLEDRIATLRVENNAQYSRIMSEVDLEQIRQKAIQKLGMSYVTADQIVLYEASDDDYVRQYMEIPED